MYCCKAERSQQLHPWLNKPGVCESCLQPAPCHGKKGPYLAVHHLHRLSDGGPDHPYAVAAVCPNCHREIHGGVDGLEKNQNLVLLVSAKEMQ